MFEYWLGRQEGKRGVVYAVFTHPSAYEAGCQDAWSINTRTGEVSHCGVRPSSLIPLTFQEARAVIRKLEKLNGKEINTDGVA